MKKVLSFILMLAVAVCSHAQLYVNSDGNVTIGNYTGVGEPNLNIGDDTPDVTEDYRFGTFSSIPTFYSDYNVGLGGQAVDSDNGIGFGIGVMGLAANGSDGSFGVAGLLSGTGYGAAVLGTMSEIAPSLTGRYAGYFDGPTYVAGNLTATNVYTLSDIRLKKNIVSFSELGARESALSKLLDVNVIKYNFKEEKKEDAAASEGEALLHFGVSAQELQEIYPNLVTKGQDGYLAVNYTELVPVLIRSIQELKQELDAVKSPEMRNAQQAILGGADNGGAVLYQNTPNPFTSQTVIKFKIPAGVRTASIYIFDMQGNMKKQLSVNPQQTSITIDGYELTPGLYLYSLVLDDVEVATKRMILSK